MKVGNDSRPQRIFCVDFLRGLIGTKDYQLFFVGIARMVILVTLVWMWRRYRRGPIL